MTNTHQLKHQELMCKEDGRARKKVMLQKKKKSVYRVVAKQREKTGMRGQAESEG